MRHRLGIARLLAVVLAVVFVATVGPAPTPAGAQAASRVGLLARIDRLGVVDRVREVPQLAQRGTRFFRIWFRLPVDHDHPDGPHFLLRGTLVHRGTDRPMVLTTSGYGIRSWHGAYPTEVTGLVRGNQLDLEHRFFRPSRPADPDWADHSRSSRRRPTCTSSYAR